MLYRLDLVRPPLTKVVGNHYWPQTLSSRRVISSLKNEIEAAGGKIKITPVKAVGCK